MATDIMSGISLDGYSFYYEWHEFTMSGTRLHDHNYC